MPNGIVRELRLHQCADCGADCANPKRYVDKSSGLIMDNSNPWSPEPLK